LDQSGEFPARYAAIKRKAGACKVKGIVRAKRDPGAVGDAQPLVRDDRRDAVQSGELARVHRAVFICAGEVAHQNIDRKCRNSLIFCLVWRDAKTVDAGVDHQVAATAPAGVP